MNLTAFGKTIPAAIVTQLSGAANAEKAFHKADVVVLVTGALRAANKFNDYDTCIFINSNTH